MLASQTPMNLHQPQILHAPTLPKFDGPSPKAPHAQPKQHRTTSSGEPLLLEQQRGTISDDPCLTIELSEWTCSGCFWDERDFDVKMLSVFDKNAMVYSVPASVSVVQTDTHDAAMTTDELSSFFARTTGGMIYPISLLGKNHEDVIAVLDNDLTISGHTLTVVKNDTWKYGDTSISIKPLKEGSKEIGIFTPQQITSVVVQYWVDEFRKNLVSNKKSTDKSDKKKRRMALSIIIPSYFSCRQRLAIVDAVSLSGHTIRRVLPRGISAVAGALRTVNGTSELLRVLKMSQVERGCDDIVVLYLHADDQCWEVALILCEGGQQADKTGFYA